MTICRWLVVSGCSILGLLYLAASPGEAAWQQLLLPYRNVNVTRFALAPSSPSTVYMVAGNTVYRSDRRGSSWSRSFLRVPSGSVARAIAVSSSDRDRVLLSVSGAVYETVDGGANWVELSPPIADSIRQLLIHPTDSGVVFAVPGGTQPGVYRSRSGGVSWEFLSADLQDTRVRQIALHAATPNVLVGATESGVIRSTDGGEAWAREEGGPYLTGVAWSADPSRVFTVGSPGLSRSDDAGETFVSLGWPNPDYGWSCAGLIATHPTDADKLVLAGCGTGYGGRPYAGVVQSDNGGEDFAGAFLPNSDWEGRPTGLAIDPVEPDNIYYSSTAGRSGGFRHFPGPGLGGSHRRNAEFHHYGVSQVSSDSLGHTYAIVDTRLAQSNAAGTSWWAVHNPYWEALWQGGPDLSLWVNEGGPAFYTVSGWTRGPTPSSDAVTSGYTFYTRRTLNRGLTWETLWSSICGYRPTECEGSQIVTNHGAGDVFYFLGASYSVPDLYRVDEAGEVLVSSAHGAAKLLIHPDDPLRVYSTFGDRSFSESLDGGSTWRPVDEGLPGDDPVAIFMRRDRPEVFQFVYANGSIYRSVDAARSWELTGTMDVGEGRVTRVTWDPRSGHVFALTREGRLVSTWPLDTSDLPPGPRSIHYSTARRTLLLGTAGNGLFERPLRVPPAWVHSEIAPEPSRGPSAESPEPALSLSPNPAGGPMRVRFRAPDTSRLRVDVFDAGGRLVRRLLDRSDHSRPTSVEWNGRSERGDLVPSGVYFVRLEAGSLAEVRKVTIIR